MPLLKTLHRRPQFVADLCLHATEEVPPPPTRIDVRAKSFTDADPQQLQQLASTLAFQNQSRGFDGGMWVLWLCPWWTVC